MEYYHGSSNSNITVLEPQISEHKEEYVYLTTNKVVAAFYCVKILPKPYYYYSYGFRNNIPVYTDYYKDSLKEIYKNKKGYIYTCEEPEQMINPTNIYCAFTTHYPVNIKSVEEIDDMYEWFLRQEKLGNLIIERYDELSEEQLNNIENIITKEIQNELKNNTNSIYCQFLKDKFSDIWDKLNNN